METIFGVPTLQIPLLNHISIKKSFKPYIECDDFFSEVPEWQCNAETTFQKDNNFDLPWDIFIENATTALHSYLGIFPIDKPYYIEVYAWLNRYSKGQYQEVHNHAGDGASISCAYMLDLPQHSADFVFYQAGNDFWHFNPLRNLCSSGFPFNNRVTPNLTEGDIIFFPSYIDHYVGYNRSEFRRSTISANFYIKPINHE